ncbi:MAG: MerC domain-containing protein [Planctomycetota bacterium]
MTTIQASAFPDSPALETPSRRWDRIGLVASLACAVHCLAAPFVLMLMPLVGGTWSHPAAHWVLAALVLPLAGWVVWRGFRRHRRRSAPIAAALGAGFIVAGLILPEFAAAGPVACTEACCPSLVPDPETGSVSLSMPAGGWSTLAGSVLLVLAHGINLYGCRCCNAAST